MSSNIYVVVADASQAKFYGAKSSLQDLELIQEYENPQGRLKPQEINSDRPGRQDNVGGGHHGLGGDKDPRQQAEESFARQLCQEVNAACLAEGVKDLKIIAAPHFLGLLRKHLSDSSLKLLSQTVDKDLLREDLESIRAHLQ